MFNSKQGSDQLTGLTRALYNSILKNLEVKTPVEVLEVNDDRTKVTVKILIDNVDKNNNRVERESIIGVPVFTAGAGDWLMSFPVAVGDKGWIDAVDRDMSVFLQGLSSASPPTRRMHSFSDAVFYPDIMQGFTISSEDTTAMVLQNTAGTIKIALDGNAVRVTHGESVLTVSPSSVDIATTTFNVVAPSGIKMNGAQITPAGNIISASGIGVDTHYHTQDNDSANNVQQPTSTAVAGP